MGLISYGPYESNVMSHTQILKMTDHTDENQFSWPKINRNKNDYSAKIGKNEKKIGQKLEKMSKTVKIRKMF